MPSRKPSPIKASAVHQLVELFRRYGYDGATLSAISEATGLGRASLYHHFPGGKQEMAEAVLDRVGEDFQALVLAPLDEPGSPRDRLRGLADGLLDFYGGGAKSCLIGVFAFADADRLFVEIVRAQIEGWIDRVAEILVAAGLDAEIARSRSEESLVLVQGALLVARGRGDVSGFAKIVNELPDRLLAD